MQLTHSNKLLRKLYFHLPDCFKNTFAMAYSVVNDSKRYGGVFQGHLVKLEKNVTRSRTEIEQDQLENLKKIVIHAGTTVPYYVQLFKKIKFDPARMTSLDDLRKIPVLEKETVRTCQDDFISSSHEGKRIIAHTSGTTGKALKLFVNKETEQYSYAGVWFHYGWSGIKRGARIATFSGHPVAEPARLEPPFWVFNRIENELLFSSQHITPQALPAYIDALNDFQPELIRGYPSSIYLIALHLLDTGKKIMPKAVYTSSETLLDFQRKVIEDAFACKVFSYYGNAERVAQIMQCEEGNFHVLTETCVVEVLNPDGSPTVVGEEGDLVCTGLINQVMPLIRYKIGDRAIPGPSSCICGRNSPVLSTITGRVDDIIITPDGRHVGRLGHVFKNTLNVKEAQIIQDNIQSILVKIVPRQNYSPQDKKMILNELRFRLGNEIHIKIEEVIQIPRTKNGKQRFIISSVPLQIAKTHNESTLKRPFLSM
ncbi:phenylacetate--CoA ligase family protein [candidate division KSB1 bacterium]|nr:phenylacetate--CoA ligase family protein [candidate division KSB1 bacterium]